MKKTKEEYYQANPLVQARKNYNLIEHQLFRLAIADLNPKLRNSQYYDEQFPTFHLSTDEVVKMFQGEKGNSHSIYEKLLISARNMAKSNIEIGTAKAFKIFPVFDTIEFTVKDGLTVIFHRNMKPFLLDFDKGNYTRCYLQLAFELSSRYSLILLELMLQYRGAQKNNIIERRITPEELKFALDVDDNAYKDRINNFKLKVINPAIKEINEKTNYYIEPDYKIERGRWRKIKAFVFTLILPNADEEGVPKAEPKKEAIPAPVASPKSYTETTSLSKITPSDLPQNFKEVQQQEPKVTRKKLEDFTEEEAYALAKLLRFKISEKVAFETLEKFGVKAINWAVENYQTAKNRGVAINNPAGFILDKVQEFEEVGFTADDIFKLVEKFEAQKNAQIKKENEEAEHKKIEEQELQAAIEEARLKNRNQYTEKEIDELIDILAKEYEISDKVFTESICEQLDRYGIMRTEILKRYVKNHFRR